MTARTVLTWCAGCEQYVSRWNKNTDLCTDCTTAALKIVRQWAGDKTRTRVEVK